MDWILAYRINDSIEPKVRRFIENCESIILDKENQIINRRESRIEYIIGESAIDINNDVMSYLNIFINDFKDDVCFIEAPVGTYMYYETSSNDIVSIKSRAMCVSSYMFDSYLQMREFLIDSIESKSKICVFTYKIFGQHQLRCFIVGENDTKEWANKNIFEK